MEIQHLKSFIAVARAGHLTRASEQLHLTQSAVSKQIKALERELGVALFERLASGMTLTSAGRRLLASAERTMNAAAEMLNIARALQDQVSGTLLLGTIVDPESIRLGSLLGTLIEFHPQIDVKLWHGISGSVRERLAAGELDACFHLGPVSNPAIAVVSLGVEHYVVAAPASWHARLVDADWERLAEMPWVGTPSGSSQNAMMRSILADKGLKLQTIIEADQEASMIDLVRSGVALCLMRERLAREAAVQGHAVLWDGPSLPCPLSLLYRRVDADAPVMQALLQAVRTVWNTKPLPAQGETSSTA